MKYSVNATIHGFRVRRAEKFRETEDDAFLLEHERTGAQVFWLDNNAENMVFSIKPHASLV